MKTGFGPISRGHGADHGHVGHGPHAMNHAQVVGRLERRDRSAAASSLSWTSFFGSGYRPKIWLRFALQAARQQQTVLLRARHRLFVRIDVPFAESLKAGSGP